MTSTPTRTVDFYFDFISPFAYFAWLNLADLRASSEIVLRAKPILFPGVLKHWGQLGPAEIEPKRIYTFKTIVRYAKRHNIPLQGPATHPFNPLLALRLALQDVAGSSQHQVIDTIFRAGWGAGIDMADHQQLLDALQNANLEGEAMLAATQQPEVKAALRRNTEEAISHGVFGVPTCVVERELFWGNDGLEDLRDYLRGEDPLDPSLASHILMRPRGAERKEAVQARKNIQKQ